MVLCKEAYSLFPSLLNWARVCAFTEELSKVILLPSNSWIILFCVMTGHKMETEASTTDRPCHRKLVFSIYEAVSLQNNFFLQTAWWWVPLLVREAHFFFKNVGRVIECFFDRTRIRYATESEQSEDCYGLTAITALPSEAYTVQLCFHLNYAGVLVFPWLQKTFFLFTWNQDVVFSIHFKFSRVRVKWCRCHVLKLRKHHVNKQR